MKTEAVINAMNWTGMVLNLIGFYLNTRRSIWGYFMWMISGPLLFCVMWHEGLMPQMILLSFYFAYTAGKRLSSSRTRFLTIAGHVRDSDQ